MKICLSFKTPDVADGALEELDEAQRKHAMRVIEKFVEYGEYVTIEIDLEDKTARVIPVRS